MFYAIGIYIFVLHMFAKGYVCEYMRLGNVYDWHNEWVSEEWSSFFRFEIFCLFSLGYWIFFFISMFQHRFVFKGRKFYVEQVKCTHMEANFGFYLFTQNKFNAESGEKFYASFFTLKQFIGATLLHTLVSCHFNLKVLVVRRIYIIFFLCRTSLKRFVFFRWK